MRILRIPSAYFLELKIMVKNRLFCNMVFRMQAVAVEKVLLRAHTHKCRGAGSILRRRGQLPEKGTFSMTNIRIITKKASLTFPILSLRGGGGGGSLTCLKVGEHASFSGYLFLKSAGIISISF